MYLIIKTLNLHEYQNIKNEKEERENSVREFNTDKLIQNTKMWINNMNKTFLQLAKELASNKELAADFFRSKNAMVECNTGAMADDMNLNAGNKENHLPGLDYSLPINIAPY